MKVSALFLLGSLSLTAVVATAPAQSNYEPYSFATLAGYGPRFADGTGGAARFDNPNGVAVDGAGNIYVADTANSTIRRITPAGVVTTFAGSAGNIGSADGAGSAARFNGPEGIAIDGAGNLYVADQLNVTIRKITPAGVVSTFAGLAGAFGSADGTGSAARFSFPGAVAVDGAGNVYVADSRNYTVRKITPSGTVSTIAGVANSRGTADGNGRDARFGYLFGIAVDGAGNVYVSDHENSSIRKITPANDVSTLAGMPGSIGRADGFGSAARFYSPMGLAVDGAGNVYVADQLNHTIRRITPAGDVSTVAGLAGFDGSSDGTGSDARFFRPSGVIVDSGGNLYVGDTYSHTIRRINPSGDVSTFAGLGGSFGSVDGPAPEARFARPEGVAVDRTGTLYVADSSNRTIRKIDPSGSVSTLAGLPRSNGLLADGIGSEARFGLPIGIAVDGAGNVYVGDTFGHAIRKITPDGEVSTFAGRADTSGSADGTGNAARFRFPYGVAVDGSGNVYVADRGNHTIRKITPAGVVTTFAGTAGSTGSADGTGSAARFNQASGIATDQFGNVYVADESNHTIRKITPAGVVTTVAGTAGTFGSADGTGSSARFYFPTGVTVDSAGNLYVAERANNTIRKITPSRVVTTLAGRPQNRGSMDGTANAARFSSPQSLAVDGSFNLYVADTDNDNIRYLVAGPPIIASPLTAAGVLGEPFVYQFQAARATSLAVTNLPPGLRFESSLSAIVGTPTQEGTFQLGLSASNSLGTAQATLSVIVQPPPAAGPLLVSSTAATGRTGNFFRFQLLAAGGTSEMRFSATALPAGLTLNAATGVISGTPTFDGSSAVTVTATEGNITSTATLQLTFTSDPAVPVIVSKTEGGLTPGQPFSYTIEAPTSDPTDPVRYARVGALPDGLEFDANSGTIFGTPTFQARRESRGKPLSGGAITNNVQIFAGNSRGTSTIEYKFLSASKGVVNISTRVSVQSADNVLIGGFIVTGIKPKKVVIRAIGPSLTADGAQLPGALQDPVLQLVQGDTEIGSNDDWRSAKDEEDEIKFAQVPPGDNREAAIVAFLNPGSYTAIVSGRDGGTGIGLVELYDAGNLKTDSIEKLANISTRGLVQPDDGAMIGGFIVRDNSSRVVVRAIGPSLASSGVSGALEDTTLELVNADGFTIADNDDWRSGNQEQQIRDTGVSPTDDRESAIVATLSPAPYTAVVRGKDGSTGVALVEAYVLE